MVKNTCTQPMSYLLILCALSVSVCANVGQCYPNTAWVERLLGIYSDLSVAYQRNPEEHSWPLQIPFSSPTLLKIILTHQMFGNERFSSTQNTFHVAV